MCSVNQERVGLCDANCFSPGWQNAVPCRLQGDGRRRSRGSGVEERDGIGEKGVWEGGKWSKIEEKVCGREVHTFT